jgi:hypothetical protein
MQGRIAGDHAAIQSLRCQPMVSMDVVVLASEVSGIEWLGIPLGSSTTFHPIYAGFLGSIQREQREVMTVGREVCCKLYHPLDAIAANRNNSLRYYVTVFSKLPDSLANVIGCSLVAEAGVQSSAVVCVATQYKDSSILIFKSVSRDSTIPSDAPRSLHLSHEPTYQCALT